MEGVFFLSFEMFTERNPEAYMFEGNAWEFFEAINELITEKSYIDRFYFMPMEVWGREGVELVEEEYQLGVSATHIEILPYAPPSRKELLEPKVFRLYFSGEWKHLVNFYADVYQKNRTKIRSDIWYELALNTFFNVEETRVKITYLPISSEEEKHVSEIEKERLEEIYEMTDLIKVLVRKVYEFLRRREQYHF